MSDLMPIWGEMTEEEIEIYHEMLLLATERQQKSGENRLHCIARAIMPGIIAMRSELLKEAARWKREEEAVKKAALAKELLPNTAYAFKPIVLKAFPETAKAFPETAKAEKKAAT